MTLGQKEGQARRKGLGRKRRMMGRKGNEPRESRGCLEKWGEVEEEWRTSKGGKRPRKRCGKKEDESGHVECF